MHDLIDHEQQFEKLWFRTLKKKGSTKILMAPDCPRNLILRGKQQSSIKSEK